MALSNSGSILSRKSSRIDLSSSVSSFGVTSFLAILSNSSARESDSTLLAFSTPSSGCSGLEAGGVDGGEGDLAGEGMGGGSPPAMRIACLSSTSCISGVL